MQKSGKSDVMAKIFGADEGEKEPPGSQEINLNFSPCDLLSMVSCAM